MELFLRLLGLLQQNILCKVVEPFYWLRTTMKIVIPLQPIRAPILTLSATQIAAKIRSGELCCDDVVQAYMFRSKRVNMKLNAIVEECYTEAFKVADKVDQLIASKAKSASELEKEMPLLGVPITVEESCKVAGLSYSVGCRLRAGKKANTNGATVELLCKAGAIPIAVSNQPELCMATETNNLVSGLTKNPYDEFRTVGGSSGGEAALIASAGSVVGVGSDFIGSIRCPAMFCGIFAHRPTPSIVSVEGHYPGGDREDLTDHLVVGPLTRYAEDLPLLLRVMAGDNAVQLRLDQQVEMNNLKVHFMTDINYSMGLPAVSTEIKLAIEQAVNHLKSKYKCHVQRVCFSEMSESPEISYTALLSSKNLFDVFDEPDPANPKERPSLFVEILKSFLCMSQFSLTSLQYSLMKKFKFSMSNKQISYYLKQHENLKKKIIDTLGDDGVLILPNYPTAAHYHHQSLLRTFGHSYCSLITSLGLPATSIPMGLNKKNLPIGFQVVAAPHQDRLCLAVAQEMEKAFGGWVHPPCLQTPTNGKSD